MVLHSKQQVFEIPQPQINVIEYQIFGCKCPQCGKFTRGAAPHHVTSNVQYGNMAKAFVVLMNNEYKMPIKKISQLFNILYGIRINESIIVNMLESCYDKLSQAEDEIKERILASEVGHVDEIGIRIGNKLNWLHVFSTLLHTYLFAHPKRGKEAIESEQSIIPNFKNWLIHDCWATYFKATHAQHALCNAHIIRELQSVIDNDKNGESSWAKRMQDFLINLHHSEHAERIQNQISINSTYSETCAQGFAAQPPPIKVRNKRGKVKKSKACNLLHRLETHKNSMLAFAFNERVPFTNNLAERDLTGNIVWVFTPLNA